MLLLSDERAFNGCSSHSGKFLLGSILHLVLACPTFLSEGGLNTVLLAESSVAVSGRDINICTAGACVLLMIQQTVKRRTYYDNFKYFFTSSINSRSTVDGFLKKNLTSIVVFMSSELTAFK